MRTLFDVCRQFEAHVRNIISAEPYGTGHIHDTFKVCSADNQHYLLQKINGRVFKNIPLMQNNIDRVIAALKAGRSAGELVPEMIKTTDGHTFYRDDAGGCWRMFIFIPESRTYERVENPGQAYEAGKAFGRFQYRLKDVDPSTLAETIPRFHDIYYRLALFEEAVRSDKAHRVPNMKTEIGFVSSRAGRMKHIIQLLREESVPVRITHNDTKINNVLFDKRGKAICVIDLDTVMPGYVHYDFGDAIRTGASSAGEDERNTEKMYINLALFEAYTSGFLGQVHELLNETERKTLAFAPQLMTFIIGLCFLTDYLNGDVYFKIKSADHNLVRWKAQKKLLMSMEEREEEMEKIVASIEKKL